jgi:opacity protein-like surface antigen
MRATFAVLAALLAASSASAADVPRRFAIVSGASDGGPARATLRYSTSDARQVARVLRRLGGIALDDLLLVEEPDAPALRAALAKVAVETGRARSAGQRVELFLYFSGHSDEQGLLLGRSQLPYAELRAELERVPADVRVAILDSCSSGAITRAKGGVHRPPFLLDASSSVTGHAFLTSSAADEASQESDRLKGSFFTHALLTGLRGGADASNDGVVTLNEAYQFAFRETLARTETTQGGAQHATYDIGLVGSGDVVMTDLRRADAALVIPASLEGTVFVRNAAGQLVAELRKVRGAGVELALEEGRYDVRVALDRGVSATSVELVSSARIVLDPAKLAPAALEATALRGGETAAVPLALPSPRSAPPTPTMLETLLAGPSGGRPSWLSLSAGPYAPDNHLSGSFGWAAQAGVGVWLLDFVGIEASAGFTRVVGESRQSIPAIETYSSTQAYEVFGRGPVRDTIVTVPLGVTLKLALPTPALRPYVLGGVGLEYMRLSRVLVGKLDQGFPATTSPSVDRLTFDGVNFALQAGVGASTPLGKRLSAFAEARYTFASTRLLYEGQYMQTLSLDGLQVLTGVGYTF